MKENDIIANLTTNKPDVCVSNNMRENANKKFTIKKLDEWEHIRKSSTLAANTGQHSEKNPRYRSAKLNTARGSNANAGE